MLDRHLVPLSRLDDFYRKSVEYLPCESLRLVTTMKGLTTSFPISIIPIARSRRSRRG